MSTRRCLRLALLLSIAPRAAIAQAHRDHVYVDHLYGWSVSYPDKWAIDTLDLAFVQIHQPSTLPAGSVGVHSLRGWNFTSLDDLADRMMVFEARLSGFKELFRRNTKLADGTPALEVENLLGTGILGKSRKLFVLQGDRGLAINAETYLDSFPALAPYFDKILHSFSVVAPTAHALILGVPFISWADAAMLNYHNKNMLNPSLLASLAMTLEYWGQDRRLVEQAIGEGGLDSGRAYMARRIRLGGPKGWTNVTSDRGTLDSVRLYVTRGIPLMVNLAMTPAAHQTDPSAAAVATILSSGEFDPRAKLTELQWQRVQRLLSAFAGFESGVLGKMVSLDTLRHWSEMLGHPLWRESVLMSARVVIGFDDDRKVVILHDPSFGPAWEVSYDDFEMMWSLFDHQFTVSYPPDFTTRVVGHSGAGTYTARTAGQRAAESFVFGYALASVGELSEARARFGAALSAPDVPLGYRHLLLLELGTVAQASGDTVLAASDYEQAAALIPQHHRPWLLLSHLYEHSGRAEWRANSGPLRKKAEALCRDEKARQAVWEALPHDFTVMTGCQEVPSN